MTRNYSPDLNALSTIKKEIYSTCTLNKFLNNYLLSIKKKKKSNLKMLTCLGDGFKTYQDIGLKLS